jgi:PBSX family phage terminase large subunit
MIKTTKQSNQYHQRYKRSPKYDLYVKQSLTHTWNVLTGSIRSSKSVANTLAFALNIIQSPDTLHMVAGTTSIVARSVFIENDGLGLKYFFEGMCKETTYSGHPALKISLPGREEITVLIMGMQNAGSYKGFRGISLGMVAFTEIDLLDEESVIEGINRTLASKRRRFFVDFNPTNPEHKIYSEELMYSIDRLLKTQDINYMHVTLRDNPSLTEKMINDVIKDYDPDSIQYKRFILGQRIAAQNLIYNIRDWNVIDSFNIDDYIEYVIVADPGIESSATVFLLGAVTKGYNEIHILKEYWHRNADVKGLAIKYPSDYAEDYTTFIKESIDLMGGRYPRMVFTDLDVTFQRELRDALKRNKMANINFKDAIKDNIDDRIKMGISMLWTKKLKFYKGCTKTIYSFRSAQYDAKKSIKGDYVRLDEPHNGTAIDCIDSTEYIMSFYTNKVYRK